MIFDHLNQAHLYQVLGSRFQIAFQYLRRFDPLTPPGKVILSGEDVYAVVQGYVTSPAQERAWEAHRRYVDVQYMVTGEELIYHSPLDRLEVTKAYDGTADYELLRGPDLQCVHLRAGYFGIFFSQDGHKPGCTMAEPSKISKVVIKVRLEG
jgi:YhcH/YjgK/YiaL family protein